MTKKLIYKLPPLDVAAFLFPKREFHEAGMLPLRFRAYVERGQTKVEFRRFGDTEWVPCGPGVGIAIRANQKSGVQRYYFTEPVEIEDDPPETVQQPQNPSLLRRSED